MAAAIVPGLGLKPGMEEGAIAWQKGSAPKEGFGRTPRAPEPRQAIAALWQVKITMSEKTILHQFGHFDKWPRSQLMPYTAEKFNYKHALQGKLERDGDFDHNAPSQRFKQVSQEYVSVKKRRTSSKSYTGILTPSRSKDAT